MSTKKLLSWVCVLAMLLSLVACSKFDPSKATEHSETFDVEIIYKRNQICYAIAQQDGNTSLYTFNAAGLPVVNVDGSSLTASDLKPGMCVSVKYDGYMLETYPAQFSGVKEVTVNAYSPNNVDFIAKQLSGMFPSTAPTDVQRWFISFSGETYLNEREKIALDYILSENWSNVDVTIDPTSKVTEGTGRIQVQVNTYDSSVLDLIISVDTGLEGDTPVSRKLHATMVDGAWSLN